MKALDRHRASIAVRIAALASALLVAASGRAAAQHYDGCFMNGRQVSDSMCSGSAPGGGGPNAAMMGAAGSLGFAIGAGIGGAIRNMLLDNGNTNGGTSTGALTVRQMNEQGIALADQGRLAEAAEMFRRALNADPTDSIIRANYLITEAGVQYRAGNPDAARNLVLQVIREDDAGDHLIDLAKQDLAVYDRAIAARNQAAAAQAQRQFAAGQQDLLDEIRPVHATPAAVVTPAQPRSAADQLCLAAGQAAGCIGKFTPHAATVPAAGLDPAAARQAESRFNEAIAALQARPAADATASADGRPCAVVTGFSVAGDQVRSDTGACGGTDEALSEAARVPFDTAAINAGRAAVMNGGGAAAVPIANPNTKVALFFPPVVTGTTLDREAEQVKQDACVRLAHLERQLAGYGTALRRLASTGPMIAGARAEWQQQLDETTKDQWQQLAGGLTSFLDAELDVKIGKLDKEARRALDMRINVSSSDVRQQYDIAFRALVEQRKIVMRDHDKAVALLDLWSKAYDALDLWSIEGDGERKLEALGQLSQLLVSQPSFEYAAAPVTIADLWIHAAGDLYAQWVHMKALASLNEGAENYAKGMQAIQKKIKSTSEAIQKVRDDIAHSRRSCPAA
jgi:tetratricopeptide (TPR) repeat protein